MNIRLNVKSNAKQNVINELSKSSFVENFSNAQNCARNKNNSGFFTAMQSLIVKIGIAVAKAVEGSPYVSSYRDAITYLCTDILCDESLFNAFERADINSKANVSKHANYAVHADFQEIATKYNILLNKLDMALGLDGIFKNAKLNVANNFQNRKPERTKKVDGVPKYNGSFSAEITECIDSRKRNGPITYHITLVTEIEEGDMKAPCFTEVGYVSKDGVSIDMRVNGKGIYNFKIPQDDVKSNQIEFYAEYSYKVRNPDIRDIFHPFLPKTGRITLIKNV